MLILQQVFFKSNTVYLFSYETYVYYYFSIGIKQNVISISQTSIINKIYRCCLDQNIIKQYHVPSINNLVVNSGIKKNIYILKKYKNNHLLKIYTKIKNYLKSRAL